VTYLDRRAQLDPANAARPAAGTVLCALNEINEPGGKTFRYRSGDDVFMGLVIRFKGDVIGYVDSCPHFGWPLAYDGDHVFSGDHLLCTGHGALFRALDGLCMAGPCVDEALAPWPVKVVDEEVVCA
jgi:nitrite reductase/ring-hydroxylating ferredoxin subunit